MPDHELELVRDEARRRGWHLAWRCTADCDTRGNMSVPARATALALYSLLADAHRQFAEIESGANRA